MDKVKNLFNKPQASAATEKFIRFLFWMTLAFVIVSGVVIRIKLYLCNYSFWLDEASLGMNILTKSYKKLFSSLGFGQMAPPFFMIASKFLLDVSGQADNIQARDLILRIIPLCSGLISLPLFAFAVHKIFKNNYITLISTAILSLNNVAISYCQEFKQYEVELLFTIILIFAFYTLNYSKTSPLKLFSYSLLFSFAPWCAYSSIVILLTGMVSVFIDIFKNKCYSKLKAPAFFLPLITSAILFYLIHYKKVFSAHHSHMEDYWMNLHPSFFAVDTFCRMFRHKLDALMQFDIGTGFLIAALVVTLIIFILKSNKKAVFLVLAPIVLAIALSFAHKYPFEQRLILFLLPLFAIIFAQVGHILSKNKISQIAALAAVIVITSTQFKTPNEKRDLTYSETREQAQIIISEAKRDDLIYAYTNIPKYYFSPPPDIDNVIWEKFARKAGVIKDRIEEYPKNKVIWLYTPHISVYIKEGDLEQFIKSKGYKLLKSERKAQTQYIKFIK